MPGGTAGTAVLPGTRQFPVRVRQLLQAGDVVLSLPDKAEILCPCCGYVMIFFHALRTRTRARPPPLPLASSCANVIPA
jgi:hypothetical protein